MSWLRCPTGCGSFGHAYWGMCPIWEYFLCLFCWVHADLTVLWRLSLVEQKKVCTGRKAAHPTKIKTKDTQKRMRWEIVNLLWVRSEQNVQSNKKSPLQWGTWWSFKREKQLWRKKAFDQFHNPEGLRRLTCRWCNNQLLGNRCWGIKWMLIAHSCICSKHLYA